MTKPKPKQQPHTSEPSVGVTHERARRVFENHISLKSTSFSCFPFRSRRSHRSIFDVSGVLHPPGQERSRGTSTNNFFPDGAYHQICVCIFCLLIWSIENAGKVQRFAAGKGLRDGVAQGLSLVSGFCAPVHRPSHGGSAFLPDGSWVLLPPIC